MRDFKAYPSSFWEFIEANSSGDLIQIALALSKKEVEFSKLFALLQIKARQRTQEKLPTWLKHPKILFPKILSVEQSSSERTAFHKLEYLEEGNLAIDLTGGLGVDAWAFSHKFKKVIYVEQDENLVATARYNFDVLGAKNIECIHAEASQFLKKFKEISDVIYIDPARRDIDGGKVSRFEDCSPNVVDLLPSIKAKAKKLLVKASPMMDIHQGVQELGNVKKVLVIAKKNEVKELLFQMDFNDSNPGYEIEAINLRTEAIDSLRFSPEYEKKLQIEFSLPLGWLYEPNAAILKSGAYKSLVEQFSVNKLHPNTHLYTSESKVEHFPGRVFKILNQVKYSRKEIAQILPEKKAIISARNFPDSPQKMYKKLKIKEGGKHNIFGVRLMDNSLALLKVVYQSNNA